MRDKCRKILKEMREMGSTFLPVDMADNMTKEQMTRLITRYELIKRENKLMRKYYLNL